MPKLFERLWTHPPATPWRYALAVLCVLVTTPAVAALHQVIAGNLTVLYAPAVIAAAVLAGAGPALAASVAAFLAYDVLFVPPEFTLTVSDPQEWVNLLVFLATAAVTSQIASVARTGAVEARRNEREATTQFRLVSALSDNSLDSGLRAAASILAEETGCAAVGISIDGAIRAGAGAPDIVGRMGAPRAIADAAIVARAGAHTGRRWLRPRRDPRSVIGPSSSEVPFGRVRIANDDIEGWIVLTPLDVALRDPRMQRILVTAGTLIGTAVRRERLTRTANEAAVLRDADRLRTSMLDAVSHDLRTPLSSMIASAETLLQPDVTWSEADQHEFLHEIVVEGRWLDRMVRHLLDFSRIEAGALRLAPTWLEPQALVEEAVRRLALLVEDHPLIVDVPSTLDAVLVDEVATSEIIANLVENAAKHTPAGTPITVRARQQPGLFEISVEDTGPGVPAAVLPHLFEPFAAAAVSHRRSGTGLGLAIARALVEAHGGSIRAENRPAGGARFLVTFPQHVAPVPLAPSEVGA